MKIKLYPGDNRDVLRRMKARGEFVHSVVTDGPYGLDSIVKRFGKEGSAPAKHGTDGAFSRQSKGFMGKKWDGTHIERDPEFWKLVYDVLLPGGYIVSFSSSRTYHHMAVAIEQAGFITHPMIGWTYASGMPKAHSAARAVDQELGAKGSKEVTGDPVRRIRPGADQNRDGSWEKLEDREYVPGVYVPATAEAQEWNGWYYGGQVRKPALEPIYVGQKPFSTKNGARNILEHGVGAVNVETIRVGERWPANLIHDGSEEVLALFPQAKGAIAPVRGSEPVSDRAIYGEYNGRNPSDRRDEGGSAARFFESYPFEDKPVFHHQKARARDRVIRCTGCDTRTTGRPTCDCKKSDGKRVDIDTHPTVKPPTLIEALIRHVTPVGGWVLDPFAGTGTTGQAALNAGMRAVLIEQEDEYVADIRHRLGITETIRDLDILELLGEEPCPDCANTGWYYGDEILGECGCGIEPLKSTTSTPSIAELIG